MFRTARVIIPWIAFAASLPGQTSALSGPSLGFVFDSDAKGIRPILGIPGAASLGQPLDLGITVVKASVSAQEDYILAFSSDSSLLLVRSDNGVISTDTNVNVSGVPDLIAISPGGQSAALYYRQKASVQVLTGLPKSINVTQTVDISGLPNSLDTLAVTDDGQSVLAGFPENTTPGAQSGEVFIIPADGTAPRSLFPLGHASAITLLNNSRDVLVTDDAQNALYRIADVTGAASVSQVFGPDAQVTGPLAVQPSQDNQKYFVAAQSGKIVVIDVAGADPVTLKCFCTPTGLHRLNGRESFQLTETSDGLIWMLDWDPLEPRFLFVPPAVSGNPTSTETDSRDAARLP